MDPAHLQSLIDIEQDYWWHVSKRALVRGLLDRTYPPPARLVEGGVGGGANLLALAQLGYDVAGMDQMPEAIDRCHELGLTDASVHDLTEPWPFPPESVRVALLLDVLEHIEDAVGTLRRAAAVLAPGGGVILTVPAGPYLMGPWDRMLGHVRRYTASLLRQQAAAADLETAWLSHWNAFSLPPALVVRTTQKLLRRQSGAEFPAVPSWLNAFLTFCGRCERSILSRWPLPVGLSLVALLKKTS